MAIIDNRNVVSDELDSLAILLNQWGGCEDTAPITGAANFCRNFSDNQLWRYQLNRLVFNLMYPPGDTIPLDKGTLTDLKVIFSINLNGKYLTDFTQIINPFDELAFDIEFQCTDPSSDYYISAWHLDKHISQPNDPPPKFHHPEYHIAFGGKNMTGKADFGSLFLLTGPRLPHPPMDAILGIDFIIRNFYEKEINQGILTNTTYIELVQKAQFRYWRSFSLSFASKWFTLPGITISNDYNYNVIFPELF
jgi:hypothetical protein